VSEPTVTVEVTCPTCGYPVGEGERFCENCGAALVPDAVPAAEAPAAGLPAGVAVVDADLAALPGSCAACGGRIAADGYCEECGTPARRARDHWAEEPAPWVAAVCDRGVRHARNEDAIAVAARAEPGSFAALVVCDGVSSAPDSDRASLGAARAARDVLARADGARDAEAALRAAGAAAHTAAAEVAAQVQGKGDQAGGPPSTTFVAALLAAGRLAVGWVGDSRAYWLPDGEPGAEGGEQLTADDSWAAEAMALGVPRAEAESGPNAHAITRWLGADAPDPRPRTVTRALDAPGWLLLCSDGLWNYCSDASDLARLVAGTAARDPAPGALAASLVAWAVEQGGADNISVALARVQ
jgi:serine/threonine protein phosphatase PrpC